MKIDLHSTFNQVATGTDRESVARNLAIYGIV